VFCVLFAGCFGFQTLDTKKSNLPNSDMKVWFFDVGQGDAIFIQTSDNKQILVDGGPGESVLSKLGAVMPFWDRTIDMIVLTHPHSDHVSGLIEVLDRYQVDQVVMTGVEYQSYYLDAFEERVKDEGAEVIYVDQEMEIGVPRAAGGVPYSLLSVYPDQSFNNQYIDELNTTSIVLELIHGQTSVLLTGDIYVEQETEVLQNLTSQTDILKVPHQGSISSTSVRFLEALDLETAIITVGEDNTYGHPHPAILQRLQDQNIQVYRTDLDGDVLLISDGQDHEVIKKPLIF
jgi:competence protein ComEC